MVGSFFFKRTKKRTKKNARHFAGLRFYSFDSYTPTSPILVSIDRCRQLSSFSKWYHFANRPIAIRNYFDTKTIPGTHIPDKLLIPIMPRQSTSKKPNSFFLKNFGLNRDSGIQTCALFPLSGGSVELSFRYATVGPQKPSLPFHSTTNLY